MVRLTRGKPKTVDTPNPAVLVGDARRRFIVQQLACASYPSARNLFTGKERNRKKQVGQDVCSRQSLGQRSVRGSADLPVFSRTKAQLGRPLSPGLTPGLSHCSRPGPVQPCYFESRLLTRQVPSGVSASRFPLLRKVSASKAEDLRSSMVRVLGPAISISGFGFPQDADWF
jgi:hypothetical protein